MTFFLEKLGLRLGHLASASEVVGGHTLPFKKKLNSKMVGYVLLRPLRPELDSQEVEVSSREDTSSPSR
jgi:hypothetical protein